MSTPENTKLCDFTSTNNNDFICTPIAPPASTAEFYEIKPALLNLVMKEQFSGVSTDDAAAHLNNFVELCEMQKYKDMDGDIIKLKLFPFSLRGRAKEWLLSLPRNSIDSWTKCKDAFIGKYYPPAKIISLRSSIMNFKQLDNEHVAQAWERMKSLVKNCPTHGLTTWMIIQTFYAGLNFSSRNLLDSASGGTFMSITLGAATKLLDDMMINYSEWHTERAPQGKKVNSVEETSSLSDKIDAIMSMLVNGRSHVDPNNVPLASLVAQEEHVDVNFIKNNNFNNNAYRNNFGSNNYKPYPSNGYGNSYGNSYSNNRSVSSDLEAMLKEFISTQKAFNKTVEEKFEKIDVLSSKVDSLAHDVEILKLKVMPNEVKDIKSFVQQMPSKFELIIILGCWLNCMLGGKKRKNLKKRIV
jgi:Retrotransposon gag protein